MRITIVTLFPEFFDGPLSSGLMARAREAGIVDIRLVNPRDAATDKHRAVDDRPYGGGPGMVMLPGPLADTLRGLGFVRRGEGAQPGRLIYLSPKGRAFDQALARELAGIGAGTGFWPGHDQHSAPEAVKKTGAPPSLTLICGRYEGMDARIEEIFPVECVSVGDFVLNGGEAAALCLVEAVARLLPGYMGHEASGDEESFSAGLLEYPHYTRPETFEGLDVPEVLRSGDHGKIALWRRQAALAETLVRRPELLRDAGLSDADMAFLRTAPRELPGRNLYCALVHYPVLDRSKNSVAVSLTNLDIHDIARSSCTYGLGGYYIVTPLEDQQNLLEAILRHWSGSGAKSALATPDEGARAKQGNPDRDRALKLVRGCPDVDAAVQDVTRRCGMEPVLLGTSARQEAKTPAQMGYAAAAQLLRERPVLLLFGTGHGLAPQLVERCAALLPPIRGFGAYNHLSVRSAAAITLDRLLGDAL